MPEVRNGRKGLHGYLDRRLAGQLAGLLFVGSGALTAVTLLLPQPASLDRFIVLVASLVAVFVGGVAFVFPWRLVGTRASLVLVPLAFVLIAATNYYGNTQPYTYAIFFIVVFVWTGIAQPRWTSTWLAPLAVVAYAYPLISRPEDYTVGLASTALAIPVCVLVGESIAWVGEGKERSRQRTLALAHVAQALGPHLNVEAVATALVEEFRVALNTTIATFVQLDPRARTIRDIYSTGLDERLREDLSSLKGSTLGDNPSIAALARGEPEVIEDARHGSQLLPNPERIGIRSYLSIPVLVGDELAGILSCAEPAPRRYSGDDIVLARALASQASAALSNATLYEQAHQASLRDPLTGLGNRRAFHERLGHEITRAQRYNRPLSLIVLDVDSLKPINDAQGHLAGDRALERLAGLLEHSARREDGVFRLGGDEFALVLPETPIRGAAILGERIRRSLRQSATTSRGELTITASIGISSFPDNGLSLEELFERADAALYEVKYSGGDAVALAGDRSPSGEGHRLGVDLGSLIDDRRLKPLYQPIVALDTGAVVAFEAFCRLDEVAGAAPTPTLFKAASMASLTDRLDRCCLEVSLSCLDGLPDDALLFVNLSPATLALAGFDVGAYVDLVERAGLTPERVVLELTEQNRDRWSASTIDHLEACRSHGFGLAIDCFGATERDVELLTEIRFDHAKVHLGFVAALTDAGERRDVLSEILAPAREASPHTVAEGVETLDDLELVRALSFDAVQGFFIKDPGPGFEGPRHLDLIRSA